MKRPLRVLHLSRNYPSRAVPFMGMWAERLARVAMPEVVPIVIAPVPWTPSIFRWTAYPRLLALPRHSIERGIETIRPKVPLGPGRWLHARDASWNLRSIAAAARQAHEQAPIDLIHAHFIYPDGVQAAAIGRQLGVPVVTTEHAEWGVWFERHPNVLAQVMEALPHLACVTAVSPATYEGTRRIVGERTLVEVLPNVVDDDVFALPSPPRRPEPNLVLYAGATRHVKGLDVLAEAMRILVNSGSDLRLAVHGDPFYRGWWRESMRIRRQVRRARLREHISFGGPLEAHQLAARMAEATVFVLPSRRETFGASAAEALACGTPVVATRCGGPEDFISDAVGALVPPDDPRSLAEAIRRIASERARFDPARLRASVVTRFGKAAVKARLLDLYDRILRRCP